MSSPFLNKRLAWDQLRQSAHREFCYPALCFWWKWLPQRCTFRRLFTTPAAVLAHIQCSSTNKKNWKHRFNFRRIWTFQNSQVWPHEVNRHSCINARSREAAIVAEHTETCLECASSAAYNFSTDKIMHLVFSSVVVLLEKSQYPSVWKQSRLCFGF